MLLGLEDGLYLEVIAIDPDATGAAQPRWFDLDRFAGAPRVTNWICRSDFLVADLALLPGAGTPVELERGDFKWRMAVPEFGVLPWDNCHPAVMEWDCKAHPVDRLPASGLRLTALKVSHPEADALQLRLSAQLRDERMSYEAGAPGLSAVFETPDGVRVL